MNKPIVFIGPTIDRADAASMLDGDFRPPAALGDVLRAARESPPAIGIVDGFFHRVPAVWHKEILFAMRGGVAVFGAASMGALRAAELHRFGMVGVGEVFKAYAAGMLEDDDEVAVAHADGSLNFRRTSEAMVNIRATLEKAERCSVIGKQTRARLESIAKSLFYPDRVWPAIIQLARDAGLPAMEIERLAAWLRTNQVDRKREDAVAMLAAIRDFVASPERSISAPEPVHTILWQALLDQERMRDDIAVLEELKLDPRRFDELFDREGAIRAEAIRQLPDYEQILRRAFRKRSLDGDGCDEPGRDELMRWFFEERLGGWPRDIEGFLRVRGWTSEEGVTAIARREYRWRMGRGGR